MKQPEDYKTLDLLGPNTRGRGRPSTGKAKSAAERQRQRRERLRAAGEEFLTVHIDGNLLTGLRAYIQFKDLTPDQVIDRLLRQQLLRKR